MKNTKKEKAKSKPSKKSKSHSAPVNHELHAHHASHPMHDHAKHYTHSKHPIEHHPTSAPEHKHILAKHPMHKPKVVHKHHSAPAQLTPANEREVAMSFATEVHKRFTNLIKATILFGSQAKGTATTGSDIDIIIVIDDAAISWDLELIAWYREELAKIISANDFASELHINTVKLTTWWQDLMHGDPVVINVLRYGDPLIDLGGFFTPLKALLVTGKIHSTPEAVYAALQRAPSHLARSKAALAGAIEGIYWTMVDSAQAALITLGKMPPSPEHIAGMLKESFVDTRMLKMDLVTWYRDVFILHKSIVHGDIREVRGAEIEMWQGRAEQFLRAMTQIIDSILEAKKNQ